MPTHGFTYANNKKPIFDPKIRVFLGYIGILLNEFEKWFNLAIRIWLKIILEENFQNSSNSTFKWKFNLNFLRKQPINKRNLFNKKII